MRGLLVPGVRRALVCVPSRVLAPRRPPHASACARPAAAPDRGSAPLALACAVLGHGRSPHATCAVLSTCVPAPAGTLPAPAGFARGAQLFLASPVGVALSSTHVPAPAQFSPAVGVRVPLRIAPAGAGVCLRLCARASSAD